MRIANLPTDTELLDGLEKALAGKLSIVNITNKPSGKKGTDFFRVGRGSMEVSLRIALRVYLQQKRLLPSDQEEKEPSDA